MKKLSDFNYGDLHFMDYVLFTSYQYTSGSLGYVDAWGKYVKEQGMDDYRFKEGCSYAKSIIQYLLKEYYLHGVETGFNLSSKGKVICEHGGIKMLYEKQKTDINNSKRAIWALIVSLLAVIISALSWIFKVPLIVN